MRRTTLLAIFVFVGLVAVAAGLRLTTHTPNFGAVASVALFAGFFFRRWWVALLAPLAALAISDAFLGVYDWRLLGLVWAAQIAPLCARPLLRKKASLGRIGGACVGSSALFFVTTNFGVWLWSGLYAKSLAGLVACYAAALPFFRHTLTGDLAFTTLLFGSYALVVWAIRRRAEAAHRAPAGAPAIA